MSIEEILRAGIAAAESGDLSQAAALFAEAVKIDPSSEKGWLGLAFCVSSPDQREYCFRRVLVLNPNNRDAREQLARLSKPDLIPPPTRPQRPTSVEAISSSSSRRPVEPPPAPMAIPDKEAHPAQQNLSPSPVVQTTPEIIRRNQAVKQKKKTNATLISMIVAVPISDYMWRGYRIWVFVYERSFSCCRHSTSTSRPIEYSNPFNLNPDRDVQPDAEPTHAHSKSSTDGRLHSYVRECDVSIHRARCKCKLRISDRT